MMDIKREWGSASARRTGADGLETFLRKIAALYPDRGAVAFVCIGTDRSAGDSYGPWVGSLLEERGWPHVTGTLARPLDAERLAAGSVPLPAGAVVVAVDACLGRPESVGKYIVSEGPVEPGRGIGLKLPPLGDYGIAGVVNARGAKPHWSIQSASLYRVVRMAVETADAIEAAWMGGTRSARNGRELRLTIRNEPDGT